jgi:hypothetical protein
MGQRQQPNDDATRPLSPSAGNSVSNARW